MQQQKGFDWFQVVTTSMFVIGVIGFLSLPTCFAWAFEPSPAGGGWLEVSKPGGYAFVEDHDDFDANLGDKFTIEMWMYLKRPPRPSETWVLFHKAGSYLLTLGGRSVRFNGTIRPLAKGQMANISYYYMNKAGLTSFGRNYTQEMLPLNRWHHLAFVVGKHLGLNRVGYTLFINGKRPGGFATVRPLGNTHLPLYIGGTDISPPGYKEIRWDRFTGGLIDEVRVSNIARYSVEDGFVFQPPRSRFSPDDDTLALWHFDGRRAEWLKDASGNGHTLTDVDLAYFHVRSRGKLPTLWGKIKKREAISR